MRTLPNIDALKALEGQEIGASPWKIIDQEQIQIFADATEDQQWIHVDPERAEAESPWGKAVAHGFLTLSMLPHFNQQVFRVLGVEATINYGLNRVRFPAPVPSGSRIRTRVSLKSLEPMGTTVTVPCSKAVSRSRARRNRPAWLSTSPCI